jgi:hypothetical protein
MVIVQSHMHASSFLFLISTVSVLYVVVATTLVMERRQILSMANQAKVPGKRTEAGFGAPRSVSRPYAYIDRDTYIHPKCYSSPEIEDLIFRPRIQPSVCTRRCSKVQPYYNQEVMEVPRDQVERVMQVLQATSCGTASRYCTTASLRDSRDSCRTLRQCQHEFDSVQARESDHCCRQSRGLKEVAFSRSVCDYSSVMHRLCGSIQYNYYNVSTAQCAA